MMKKTNYSRLLSVFNNLKTTKSKKQIAYKIQSQSKKISLSVFRAIIVFGLSFVVIYPIIQMIVAALSNLRDLNLI